MMINEWFGGAVTDSSHKDWMNPRRYYSAKSYGWSGKEGRAEFGRIMAKQINRQVRRFGADGTKHY